MYDIIKKYYKNLLKEAGSKLIISALLIIVLIIGLVSSLKDLAHILGK